MGWVHWSLVNNLNSKTNALSLKEERIAVFLERVQDRKRLHDTEAEMGGCFSGVLGGMWKLAFLWEAQLVMSEQSLFCESRVFNHNMPPLFWTVSWYFKHAGSISVCWNNLDHKKTHMGRIGMKHRKVCTGKPQYFFSLAEVNLGFIILFKADVLHIYTGQAWRPLQENLLANAESNLAKRRPLGGLRILSYAYVHRRLGDRASLSRSLNGDFTYPGEIWERRGQWSERKAEWNLTAQCSCNIFSPACATLDEKLSLVIKYSFCLMC